MLRKPLVEPGKTFSTVLLSLSLVVSVANFVSNAVAADYGATGLIDVPSARMQSDGTFTVGGAWDGLHDSYMLTYQATPWLEGTFRYTGFNDFFHWDRNYEVKARLWQEQYLLPQVAVGIRDMVGTGVFGSEYVVATKGFGNWDATLGMGWGRLAGDQLFNNPLTRFDDRFDSRTSETGQGGELSLGNFFSGSTVGLFGGVQYQFQRWPVTVTAEYNPDSYAFNNQSGREYSPSTKLSYGLTWEALPGVSISLSHQHGDHVGFSFSAALDTKAAPPRRQSAVFTSALDLPQDQLPPQIDKRRWYDRLLYDTERQGILLVAARISNDGQQAELIVGNTSYPLWADAISRHIALADLHLPPSVKQLYFIVEDGGHRVTKLSVPRPSAVSHVSDTALVQRIRQLPPSDITGAANRTDFTTGKVNFTADINNRVQLFDPDDPLRYQVYLDIGAEYALTNHWAIRAQYGVNLVNNFDESRRQESDSVLPKVRSDVVKYLIQGESGLDMLTLEVRDSLSGDIHYRAFGGVLEEMYSGLGGEVLYWPHQSRVAFGASLAYAHQRDFDKDLDLLDYNVVTGFVSAYWATPFYNFDTALHAGRYLAKDVGATFEIRRTFANGWQVGAWATLTDVPFEDFGEGSFDKGLYFKIPLDGLLNRNTRSAYSTRMRPIQRDGGQRLENHSGNIFWDLREARFDAFSEAGERLLP